MRMILVRDKLFDRSETIPAEGLFSLLDDWDSMFSALEMSSYLAALESDDMMTIEAIAFNMDIEIVFLDIPVTLDKDYGMSQYEQSMTFTVEDMHEFEADLLSDHAFTLRVSLLLAHRAELY